MPRPRQASKAATVGAKAVGLSLKALAQTIRYDDREVEANIDALENRPFIIAIWHNRLALSLSLYQRYVANRFPKRRLAALVSASRDGAFLAEILKLYGVQPVRGSSSRRGAQALTELVRWAKEGFDLAITPDGPRGPLYQLQEGVVAASQLTGHPIVPVSYRLSSKRQLNSWDRFQVPLPFSRCQIRIADPVTVPHDIEPQERLLIRDQLEQSLRSITED